MITAHLTIDVPTPWGVYSRGLPVTVIASDRDGHVIRAVSQQFRVPAGAIAKGDARPVMCDRCAKPMPLNRTGGMCVICQAQVQAARSANRPRGRVS